MFFDTHGAALATVAQDLETVVGEVRVLEVAYQESSGLGVEPASVLILRHSDWPNITVRRVKHEWSLSDIPNHIGSWSAPL